MVITDCVTGVPRERGGEPFPFGSTALAEHPFADYTVRSPGKVIQSEYGNFAGCDIIK
jgi:hypothetical protein